MTNGAPKILSNFCSNNFFKRELLECIIEITTDVCNDVDEIYNDIRPKIDMAIEFSKDNNFELLSMPIHPFAKVCDQKISDDKSNDFLNDQNMIDDEIPF